MTTDHQYLELQMSGGLTILAFTQPLLNADAVQEGMTFIASSQTRKLILDFQSVRFLVSGSLCPDQEPFKPLFDLRKQLTDAGGCLVLCSLSPELQEVFKILRFDQIFEIQPDVTGGVSALTLSSNKVDGR